MELPEIESGDGTAEALLSVGGNPIIMAYDAGHLAAHADDFFLTWRELLGAITAILGGTDTRKGVVHDRFVQAAAVGVTGVVAIGPDDSPFWGYRPGRVTPSHLIVGTKVATRDLCIWGEWLASDRFDLWTCYPGGPAPREIHDPEIGLAQIDEAIAFWSAHAIVVEREQIEAGGAALLGGVE